MSTTPAIIIFLFQKMSVDWETHVSQSNRETAPEELFEHYTNSVNTLLQVDRLCEVMMDSDKYWFGVTRLVCGPLV